jgi:hypothetical protein
MYSHKSQISNHKFQTNPTDQNSKYQTFEHWILVFGIYLLFGYCDLVLKDLVLDLGTQMNLEI